jgi:hypothetical protein
MTTAPQPELPPIFVAFVVNGVVQDVLRTNEGLAAVMLSNPTIVDVSNWYATNSSHPGENLIQAVYVEASGEFVLPQVNPMAAVPSV